MRAGAALYALACTAGVRSRHPDGRQRRPPGNAVRPPLLALALWRRRPLALALAAPAAPVLAVDAPVRDTLHALRRPGVTAAFYAAAEPLPAGGSARRGASRSPHPQPLGARPRRAPFPLARGWERQLDARVQRPVLRGRAVDPIAYRTWLTPGRRVRRDPGARLDYAGDPRGAAGARRPALPAPGVGERRLARVPVPARSGQARRSPWQPEQPSPSRATKPGPVDVRVRYTPYWTHLAGRLRGARPRRPHAASAQAPAGTGSESIGAAGAVALVRRVRLTCRKSGRQPVNMPRLPMLARLRRLEARLLPHGVLDVLRQLALFAAAYWAYRLARGAVNGRRRRRLRRTRASSSRSSRPPASSSSRRSRRGPSGIQWLIDFSSWMYVNSQGSVTLGALVFIYLFHNASFYFVRNMFMVAMGIALVGYVAVPDRPAALHAGVGLRRLGGRVHRDPAGQRRGQRAVQPVRGGALDARRASR